MAGRGRAPAIRVLNLVNAVFFVATIVGMILLTLGLADQARLAALPPDRRNRTMLAAVAAVATLCFYPLLKAAALGQIQLVLDALFVFACHGYLRGKSAVSGVLIGLSTLIKPQMGLFLIWGLLRRDRPFIVGWVVSIALGLIASDLLYGPGWPVGYLKVLSFIGRHGESFFRTNQSTASSIACFRTARTSNGKRQRSRPTARSFRVPRWYPPGCSSWQPSGSAAGPHPARWD